MVKKVLFVCSQNRLRSPTAEKIYGTSVGVETRSAGLDRNAVVPLTLELLDWAHTVFVMERSHRNKLRKKFRGIAQTKPIVCLDIPDEYDYMSPDLVRLLKMKLNRYLGMPSGDFEMSGRSCPRVGPPCGRIPPAEQGTHFDPASANRFVGMTLKV